MSKTRRQVRGGFTLIELLAVMAIIRILASLLLTAFRGARTSAKKAVVRDEVHQIKAAWVAYLEEYRRFPTVYQTAMGGALDTEAVDILRGVDGNIVENPLDIVSEIHRNSVEFEVHSGRSGFHVPARDLGIEVPPDDGRQCM